MTRIVVGVFDRHEGVDSAQRALQAAGFPADDIHVRERPASGPGSAAERDDTGLMASVRDFLSDLFRSDDDAGAPYAEAMRRGWTVVKVEADEDRVRAAELALQQAGAVDIAAQAERWRADGWNEGRATPAAVHTDLQVTAGAPEGTGTLPGVGTPPRRQP